MSVPRDEIVRRLEKFVYDDTKPGKEAFFQALADAAIWNQRHPEEIIPKMVGGQVPVKCEACGGPCRNCGKPDYCCSGCAKICRS